MPNLQIRELPTDIYRALAADARRENRSLTQQAIVELREAQTLRRRGHKLEVLQTLQNSERRFSFAELAPGWVPEQLLAEDRNR